MNLFGLAHLFAVSLVEHGEGDGADGDAEYQWREIRHSALPTIEGHTLANVHAASNAKSVRSLAAHRYRDAGEAFVLFERLSTDRG